MTADQLLQELGMAMRMAGLQFDSNGCARLMFDGKTAVNVESDADAGCVHLYASLAPVPAEGRGAVYQLLLQGNLFGAQTLGATLAMDAQHHELVLCRTVNLATATSASFADVMEKFVTAAEAWTLKLRSGSVPAPATDTSAEPMGGFLRA